MSNRKEYTFLWFIENYSYCWHKKGEELRSPEFTIDELEGTSWYLCLYPRGYKEGGLIYISLGRSQDDGPRIFTVNYCISIVAYDGSTLFAKEYKSHFSRTTIIGWPFVKMDEILSHRKAEYLSKDILTVRCRLWKAEGHTDKVAPIYGRTRIGIEHISFLHVVEGFSALQPNNKKTFQICSPSKKECVISCIVCISWSEGKVMVEVTHSDSGQILTTCEISLLEISGKKTKCAAANNRGDAARKDIGKFSLDLTKNAIMNRKSECLPDDKLSLFCECTFSTGIEFQKIEGTQNEITITPKNLASNKSLIETTEKLATCPSVADDLRDIYSSKFLTDVELKTKGNSFPAHRIVLCARSPVFKVMMSSDMKEKNSGSIRVDDLEDGTVQQLLLFLYSDNLEDLQWETATKLYYASDKYQIEKLRMICLSFLIANVTTSTASDLLLLADTHSDSHLKKAVEDFISQREEQVFRSEEWKELMETNPLLALKTMHLKYNT